MKQRPILSVTLSSAAAFAATLAFTPLMSLAQQPYRPADAQLLRQYREASIRFDKARVLFGKKSFEGARKEADACLKVYPDHPSAHLLLAKLHYIEKSYEAALREVELAKSGHEATAALSQRMEQDRRSEVQTSITDVTATVKPSQGQVLGGRPAPSGAQRVDDQTRWPSTSGQIPAEHFFIHGNVLLRLGKPSEAAAQYEEALRVDPEYGNAATNLASIYFSARQHEKALEVVTRAERNGAVVSEDLKKAIAEELRKGAGPSEEAPNRKG